MTMYDSSNYPVLTRHQGGHPPSAPQILPSPARDWHHRLALVGKPAARGLERRLSGSGGAPRLPVARETEARPMPRLHGA